MPGLEHVDLFSPRTVRLLSPTLPCAFTRFVAVGVDQDRLTLERSQVQVAAGPGRPHHGDTGVGQPAGHAVEFALDDEHGGVLQKSWGTPGRSFMLAFQIEVTDLGRTLKAQLDADDDTARAIDQEDRCAVFVGELQAPEVGEVEAPPSHRFWHSVQPGSTPPMG